MEIIEETAWRMKRVLIVDDELLILTGLSKALRELCGFIGEIRIVVNGREAIYEVGHCFYDLCFLDIKLSDINGYYVMRDINYISPETNIILMSASHLQDDLKKVVEDGEAFFIEKPFNFSLIREVIKTSTEGRRERVVNEDGKGKRKFRRRPLSKTISFCVKDSDLLEIKGGAVDISYAGMGLETYFPLERSQVLFFSGVAHKTGIVTWSERKGEKNYRVGIRFI